MITYVRGDATSPLAKGNKIICHIVNDRGGWGKGFVLAISRKWSAPEENYRAWARIGEPILDTDPHHIVMTSGKFQLGEVQLVQVWRGLAVVNMIAQYGYKTGSKGPPIRYDALAKCLSKVRGYADSFKASVHMPKIGTGLAGGRWEQIEPLIEQNLEGIPVTVYEFP